MSKLQIRMRWLTWLVMLWAGWSLEWPACLGASCFATKLDAAHAQAQSTIPETDGFGYRATGVLWDALLKKRWVQLVDCRHPEWPAISMILDPEQEISRKVQGERPAINVRKPSTELLVHMGDVVRLWRQEETVRIELRGVAEEGGPVGTRIRVRLLSGFGEKNGARQHVLGVVRGSDDVEL